MDEGRLQAWIDYPRSGLSDAERAEIETHLAGCEDCMARVVDLRADDRASAELLGAIAAAEPPMPDFSEIEARSRASVPAGAPERARGRRLPLSWAASIVVAIGVGWMANEVAQEEPSLIVPPARPSAEAISEVAPVGIEATEAPDGAAAVEGGTPAVVREDPALSNEAPAAAPSPAATGAATAPESQQRAVELAAERQRQSEPSAIEQARAAALDEAAARELRRVSEAARDIAGQEPTWVTGRITDPSGRPLSDVVVQIPGTEASALSGADGQYRMLLPADSLAPGSQIRATFIGYGPASRDLPTGTGELTVEDLRLSPRAVQLEGVVVTGTAIASQRREVGSTITLPTPLDGTEAWRPVSPEEAEQALAVRPLRLPALSWTEITALDGADTPVIRVVHESETGEVVTLYQSRSALDVRGDAGPVRATRTTEGGLHLVLTGDPGQLDLTELLQRAEPIG